MARSLPGATPILTLATRQDGGRGVLHDEIYLVLRSALESGLFAPGHALSLRNLSEQFGTSLIPVRDALKRLVAEGSLEVLPNRTVRVPIMTRARFQELLEVRVALESRLTARATEFIDHAAVRALDVLNEEMQACARAGSAKGYLSANFTFHFQLYSAARSDVALPLVENLWGQFGPVLNGIFTPSGTEAAATHHGDVLRALRRRDPAAAAAAIAQDLHAAADLILLRSDVVVDGVLPLEIRTTRGIDRRQA